MQFLIFYLEKNSFPQISEFVEWKNEYDFEVGLLLTSTLLLK